MEPTTKTNSIDWLLNKLLNKGCTLDVAEFIWFLEYEKQQIEYKEWQIKEQSRDKSKDVIIPCDGQYVNHGNVSRAHEEKKANEIRPKIKADILVSELLPDIIWLLKYDQDLITTNELHIKEQERDKSKDKRYIGNYERKEALENSDKADKIRIQINEYISKKDI